MIPLEKQVTSLELSKRLKELGEKQDSYWKWENYSKNAYGYVKEWQLTDSSCLADEINVIGLRDPKDYEIYAAFTVAELGEGLPRSTKSYRDTDFKTEFWVCEHFRNTEYANTEANARAKMRIWLIEHKLVEVNK